MDEEKIEEGARVLSFRIAKEALYNAKEFMNEYQELILEIKKEITNEELNNLYCQFTLLFYHITDRMSFKTLEPEKRLGFMVKLWFHLWTDHVKFPEFSKTMLKAYQEETKEMYDKFLDKYSKCEELTRNVDEGLENTLLFEFSRDITKFTEHPDDIRGVMLCYGLIIDALEAINIKEILEEIRDYQLDHDNNIQSRKISFVMSDKETKKMNKIEDLRKKFGLHLNEEGKLIFNFTNEEKARIEGTLQNLEGDVLREDIADEFQEMLTSVALISLGDEYLLEAKFLLDDDDESESKKKEIDENLDQALVKYMKAASMYSMKTIFFSFAKALIMKNDIHTALEYLEYYSTYSKPAKYNDTAVDLFLKYHLQVLGFDSIQEIDDEVNRLINRLKKTI